MSPQLTAAAALVVEVFGDAPLARRRPYELLLAWRKGSGKSYPLMPHVLKSALANPIEAGWPKETETADRDEVTRDALAREIAQETVALPDVPPATALPLRLEAAA